MQTDPTPTLQCSPEPHTDLYPPKPCIRLNTLQRFNPESLDFCCKMLERSGLNPRNTYVPSWLTSEPVIMVSVV
jgi:hypothetical protein